MLLSAYLEDTQNLPVECAVSLDAGYDELFELSNLDRRLYLNLCSKLFMSCATSQGFFFFSQGDQVTYY